VAPFYTALVVLLQPQATPTRCQLDLQALWALWLLSHQPTRLWPLTVSENHIPYKPPASYWVVLHLALYFIWDTQSLSVPATNNGQKLAIVELFGWPYNDVAQECVFLGKAGWGGVRIWPAMGKWFEYCKCYCYMLWTNLTCCCLLNRTYGIQLLLWNGWTVQPVSVWIIIYYRSSFLSV